MCPDSERLDPRSRAQIEAAAKLLRNISPVSREVELRLHELARQLEWLASGQDGADEALSRASEPSPGRSSKRFP